MLEKHYPIQPDMYDLLLSKKNTIPLKLNEIEENLKSKEKIYKVEKMTYYPYQEDDL